MKSTQVLREEENFKPSGTKANARYRGVTDLNQYSNFVLESAHDMTLLSHLLTGNESTGIHGHQEAIEANYIALFNGGNPILYDSFTASTLKKVDKTSKIKVPEDLTTWEKVGGCEITKTTKGYFLQSPGTYGTCGIRTPLYVRPGEILSLRMRAKTSAKLPDFSIGSENINGTGSLKKTVISSSDYGYFVDYRLYCKNHETIYLNIFVNDTPAVLTAGSVELLDIGLYYGKELPVTISPLNGEMKTDLNQMRETLNFLKY